MPKKMESLINNKYGRLTVVEFSHRDKKRYFWKCRCDCGNEIVTRADGLKNGHTTSCGCYNKEIVADIGRTNATHGKANTRLYGIWVDMKTRCYDKKAINYHNYGGRGITMCDEWKNDFKIFYDWAILNGYAENLSIDRIDNDCEYSPNNCRWATRQQQSNNTRRNRYIEFHGVTHTLAEWSRILGFNYDAVKHRLYRGISFEQAISM